MKKNIVLILSSILLTGYGCKEEYIGQYPIDSTSPAPVSDVRIQNLKGKAVITYSLPEEDDLLCIKAVYISPNGNRKEMSSSAYSNSIELKGFGKSAKTKVELYSIDKSYNESAPVTVEIEPLDSPVYDVIKTLVLHEAFGGLKLYWENPLGEDIVLGALAKDDEGYKHIEIIYSSEPIANKAIRGLESKLTDFAFYFRDMYNNYTDTLYVQMTPIFEEEINKSNFMPLRLSSKFSLHGYGGQRMEAMWDNVYNVDDNLFYVNPAPEKIYFAFDMGVEAKLSRFRLWTRRNFMYQLHHIRTFEIWGTSDPSATTDPDNWNGWVKIMDCESSRPSGLTEGGNPTAEEVEYLLGGEEFEVPVEAPKFRYMKFKINSTWTNSTAAFINEISIWGNTK
jgi:hypothetical protein